MSAAKRRRAGDEAEESTTPKKIRQTPEDDDGEDEIAITPSKRSAERPKQIVEDVVEEAPVPPKRKRGRPRKHPLPEPSMAKEMHTGRVNGVTNGQETPRSQRKVMFSTPTKSREDDSVAGTPTIVRNADRSARRKSNRRIIERTINGDESDEDELGEEDSLARQIWDEEEEEAEEPVADEGVQEAVLPEQQAAPEIPVKRKRGRPRKIRPEAAIPEQQVAAETPVTEAEEEEEGDEPVADDRVQEAAVPEQQAVDEIPVKRKRGRPRKIRPEAEAGVPEQQAASEAPVKRKRGRPRKERPPERSPTPPERLPAHEKYFWANRPGGTKTSNNTLSSHLILNHDEYFSQMQTHTDDHEADRQWLHDLHSASFDQWIYELSQNFNICLYGYGSKSALTTSFAHHLHAHHTALDPTPKHAPKIVIINGYDTTLTPRDILTTLLSTLVPSTLRLPSQSPQLLSVLLTALASTPPSPPLTLIVNSIDAAPLRRAATQSLLGQLAAHPRIALLATADTPNFPLLWDLSLRSQFRFLFHDCTTFAPYGGREVDVVETFNELLGRSGRRVGGKDGVGFVLRSLPENARDLFRILVAEQLAAVADEDDMFAAPRAEEDGEDEEEGGKRKGRTDAAALGIEYRVLYNKSVEQFVCSGEVAFRTLLKEFHDHQMIESRKDGAGVERLWVPFRKEDLEGLLEELVG